MSRKLFLVVLSSIWMCSLANPVKAQTCSATYATWMDWSTCESCPLGDGGSEDWEDKPGYPIFLGQSLGSTWVESVENGKYLYGSYMSSRPVIRFPNSRGKMQILYYIVWITFLSYPKGSTPPSPPNFQHFENLTFVESSCPEDNPDDDDDDDDDDDCCGLACLAPYGLNSLLNFCSNYPDECNLPSCDDKDNEECPDLNLRITGTILPARRGTARISGDWCK